jgi:flagellar motor component MotA
MKTTTLTKTTLVTLVTVILFGMIASSAFASEREGMRENMRETRKDFRQELTDDQLDTLEKAHDLREAGDKDGARELLKDMGIGMPMKEMRDDFKEQHEDVKAAIESGDYEAFKTATKDAPIDIQLSEEQFNNLQEVHTLKESGDYEAARALAEELGLPKIGKRAGKAFHEKLTDDQKEVMQEAHELMKSGDKDGAKALIEEAGIEMPEREGFFKRIKGFFKKDK